ncbi:MAG TPA: hypothetical protein VD995_30820 [Azospirillum sp.]|nr:hypothetical protein [Azospirillum sp.]
MSAHALLDDGMPTLDRLCGDGAAHATLSATALGHAARPEIAPERLLLA